MENTAPLGLSSFLLRRETEAECDSAPGNAPGGGKAGSARPLGVDKVLGNWEGGGGGVGTLGEEELGEKRAAAPGRKVEEEERVEAQLEAKGPGPLTRGALGLDGPPPQGPLAQHHVAAAPPDLEDAPKQNLPGGRLRL